MTPLWTPPPSSNIDTFIAFLKTRGETSLTSYQDLRTWSLDEFESFWDAVWDFADIKSSHKGERVIDEGSSMFKRRFFPEARLNFAENLLRRDDEGDAVVFWGEDKIKRKLSHRELRDQVARLAHYLKSLGVCAGDRVAGFVPNTPEALIAMLATTSLGAVWSSCSPDFGIEGVIDRFGQIEPKVLISADGYYYGGKTFDCLKKVHDIQGRLPSLISTIIFHYAGEGLLERSTPWDKALDVENPNTPPLTFTQVGFNDPLYIMYSSGTTGIPKCIVHGVGGTLIQHLKEHQLHCDIKPDDRVFYFTTCGWMMWNWQVSALASGATLLLYDGSPFAPDGNILFEYAESEKATLFGTSAKYIDALNKGGYSPRDSYDLSTVRMITSTGSPLVDEAFDYVYAHISSTACLASISGGTDIVSCFVLGSPALPVWRGEIQAAGLGLSVEVWNDKGQRAAIGEKGELVCTAPFPAMPLYFWNDKNDAKYRASYFERFPGIWCHGDFMATTEHGGYVIYGRSDAVLNPGGVRIGTAEIYRQVEQMEDILESIVVGQEWEGDVRVVLFVKLKDHAALTEDLIGEIKSQIRSHTTPRHVPAKIIAVADIPRTKSGKITELAVRDIIHGREVKNKEALANPEALDLYKGLKELEN